MASLGTLNKSVPNGLVLLADIVSRQTAFGIMFGTVSSLVFLRVPDKPGITGLNWRLMLGSACLPAVLVCAQVYFTPESPRWLLQRGEHKKAYESLLRLRRSPLQAAIDLYSISKALEVQEEIRAQQPRSMVASLFMDPRNRRAMLASTILMFGQRAFDRGANHPH